MERGSGSLINASLGTGVVLSQLFQQTPQLFQSCLMRFAVRWSPCIQPYIIDSINIGHVEEGRGEEALYPPEEKLS